MPTPTTRHFLNALRRNPQLAAPARGTWQQEPEFLQKYAADIDMQGQLSNTELSHSVPSVFQRPIQFYRSLANSENPLHDAVTQEWRGLMAIFVLARWRQLELEARPFVIPPRQTDQASYVGAIGNGSLHLDTILRDQAPDSGWNEWWMIYCDGALLGATSPWTVVYTAAQYKPSANIPWQRDGLLIDPVVHYDPDQDRQPIELSILYAWVTATLARRGAWQIPANLGAQANVIGDALRTWQTELQRYAIPNFQVRLNQTLFDDSMFAAILQQPAELAGSQSDILLEVSKPGVRPVVVLSEQLPPEKRVFRGVFANDIDIGSLEAEGQNFVSRNGRYVNVNYVVAERLFLPDRLVKLQYSDDAYTSASPELSVPLTPAYFRYFDHIDLVNNPSRLIISRIGQTWKVTLRLPVNSGTLSVERIYREQDIREFPSETPGFAVWPDFCTPAWKENFAAYAAPEGFDVVVAPVFGDGTQPVQEARSNAHQKDVRIWPCDQPCLGFALRWREGTHELNAGMILRSELPHPKPLTEGLNWKLGVDFGTSSTTVMASRNGAAGEPMIFNGRTVFLSAPQAEARGRLEAIESALYPSAKSSLRPPFRTLLYNSAATVFQAEASNYTLRFAGTAAEDGTNKPVRDVKWGRQSEADSKSPMIVYLETLVRYIVCEAVAEGVKNLVLYWSYPLSLPGGALGKMRNFWSQQVAKRYSVDQGLRVEVKDEISESEAVCRCLAAPRETPILNVRADGISIAVDMGGGSTDVAIWSAKALLDQFSFKIAGNDILDPRYLHPDSLQAIFSACGRGTIPAPELERVLSRPEIYVNGALTEARNGANSVSQDPGTHPVPMYVHGGREDAMPWLHFRSMYYLCFTGLAYYLGTHTRIFDVELNSVEVFFGGRGSAGLTWLASDSTLIREVLTEAFLQGLGADIKVGGQNSSRFRHLEKTNVSFLGSAIKYDPHYPVLKTEVAGGLLLPMDLDANPAPGVRLGEVGWQLKDQPQPEAWERRVSAQEMAQLTPPQDFESCHIGNFLTWLRKDSNRFLTRLNLDADNLRRLWPESAAIQNQIREAADGQDHVLQPIFGYEIKALMQQYALRASKPASLKKAI